MSQPNSKRAAKRSAQRAKHHGGAVTLDGQPAVITLPVSGTATVRDQLSGHYLKLDADEMRALLKSCGGAFQTPAFARPANLRGV